MLAISEGTFQIGTDQPDGFPTDNEGPKIAIHHPAFMIDETTATNKEFASFIKETGYITEAEKFGWSFVFHYFLSEDTKMKSELVPNMGWWYAVADWSHPEGIDSSIGSKCSYHGAYFYYYH